MAEMKSRTIAREEIRRELAKILDIERLTSRITLGIATPRDLTALKGSWIGSQSCADCFPRKDCPRRKFGPAENAAR